MKHKGIIIGAGRMGSGYGLKPGSHYYTHAKAFMDLKDRVELCAFVEPNSKRAEFAQVMWGVPAYESLGAAISKHAPDVASVCTQPESQTDILNALCGRVQGVWCEKPFIPARSAWPFKLQIDYCRRFDLYHQAITLAMTEATDKRLVVMAKKDVHTVCHMTDLARFWRARLDYVDTPNEPGAYALRYKTGGDWKELFFPNGGISGDAFMKNALGNLLDAMEGKAPLISPPENAVESEKWASEILKG
jgi:hypothetical protein